MNSADLDSVSEKLFELVDASGAAFASNPAIVVKTIAEVIDYIIFATQSSGHVSEDNFSTRTFDPRTKLQTWQAWKT